MPWWQGPTTSMFHITFFISYYFRYASVCKNEIKFTEISWIIKVKVCEICWLSTDTSSSFEFISVKCPEITKCSSVMSWFPHMHVFKWPGWARNWDPKFACHSRAGVCVTVHRQVPLPSYRWRAARSHTSPSPAEDPPFDAHRAKTFGSYGS